MDNYQIKQLLKSFNYDSGDFIWFHDGNLSGMNTDSFTSSFTNMIDTGAAISAGFGGDGGAGGGGGGAGGGGGGGSG